MAVAGEDSKLKTERRIRLDGGLNSRGSPLTLDPEALESVSDMRFTEAGSLTHRNYALLKKQATWVAPDELPAPIISIAGTGVGTIPAGTYSVKYYLSHVGKGTVDLATPSAVSNNLVVALGDRILIAIPPNNLGDGVGQDANGGDDPFNGGTDGPDLVAPASNPIIVLVRKSTDPTWTVNVLDTAFAWNSGARQQRGVLGSYDTASGSPSNNEGKFPLRHIAWHPIARLLIGWVVDRAIVFSQDLATITKFPVLVAGGAPVDRSGNPHRWSRLPLRMKTLMVRDFMLAWDGIGRPKCLSGIPDAGTGQWRMIGAAPPTAAPTLANIAAGGLSAGDYKYAVTFVYSHLKNKPGAEVASTESNSSASATITLAAGRQVRVTLPTTLESGFFSINIYRTEANGLTFFLVANVAAATATYDDTIPDASIITNQQPPDALSAVAGNDMPPTYLDLIDSHALRLWGVEMRLIKDSQTRIVGTEGTNRVWFTKPPGRGEANEDLRTDIDAWPFSLDCGTSDGINALVAFRGRILLFKDLSVRQILGTGPDDVQEEEVHAGLGAMRDSVVRAGDLLYFWDEAAGPCVTDGSDFREIGYDVQPSWDADRAAGFFPIQCWHDLRNKEVHWLLSNTSIAPPQQLTNAALTREYVYYLPTKRWTQFTAATSGTNPPNRMVQATAKVILAADQERRYMTLLLASPQGMLLQEDATNVATDEQAALTINASAVFKYFLGDAFEMIKMFQCLYVYADLLNENNVMTVLIGLLSAQTFQTLGTVNALSVTRVNDVVRRLQYKTNLITRPDTGGAVTPTMNRDRALLVKITTNVPGMKIKGLCLKYKDFSDVDDLV